MDQVISEQSEMQNVDSGRDMRWAKQFGDFSEHLVMYLLGQGKNMSMALVDHVGADIFASTRGASSERSSKRYAISVKGRIISKSESASYRYLKSDADKLAITATTFKMEPAVALVFVDEQEGSRKIRVFFATLKNLDILAKDPNANFIDYSYNTKTKQNDFRFRFTQNQTKYIDDHFRGDNDRKWQDLIDYSELSLDIFSDTFGWHVMND